MKNLIKYTLFIMIIFLNFNVFATDFNVSSSITAPTCSGSNCSGGHYTALENYNVGSNNVYSINTRYNGRLGAIRFNIPLPSSLGDDCFPVGDLTYRLTLNMATEDWRNYFSYPFISSSSSGSNWATSSVVFVSQKKIYFNFKIPASNNCIDFLYVHLTSTNQSSVSFTGVSNWNFSNVVLTANFPTSPTPTPTPSGSTPTPIPDKTNQDIIDNANNNTQSIIDNNNENITCPVGPLVFNSASYIDSLGYLKTDGSISSSTNNGISPYLSVKPNTSYTITFSSTPSSSIYYCLYQSNKTLISCYNYGSNVVEFNTTSSTSFIRLSVPFARTMQIKGPICNNWEKESQDKTTNAINEVNDTMKDSNIDDKTGFFTGFQNNDHGLSSIITLPLQTIQDLANNNCVALSVPIPYTNSSVTLPCMKNFYRNYIPDIYDIWQIVSFGIISYLICIDVFKMVKGFKDPNEDKIEVLDL